jgi:SAM-dependent methyltransferase
MDYIKVKPYEKLSLIYDHVMEHVNYEQWVKYIYEIGKRFVPRDANVLELAGGNCRFSELFVKYFPDIIVTDRCLEMLSSKKNSLLKVCCEMNYLPFKSKFDLIYSTFDSVNYLTNRKNLLRLFKEISSLLKPEGIFTFDASLERNSLIYTIKPVRRGKEKNISYEHLSRYNKYSRVHKNIFEIKLDDGKIFKEIHEQKIYPFEIYFELLERTGLKVIECYETFTFKRAKSSSQRVQFIVTKIPHAVIQ